jgi:very-short-patch-repair endonuclease
MGTSRFDFYLSELNICIEFDGAQHFHIRHQRTRNEEKAKQRFKDLVRRDKKKMIFAKNSKLS